MGDLGTTNPIAVSVVYPCLNEVASVGRCVEEARSALVASGYNGEVIVVDNGSTDGSAEVAASAGARVIDEPAPGYGSALTTGFIAAEGEIIVMADADLTYPIERLGALVDPIVKDQADVVYGGRLAEADRRTMPWLHRRVGTPALHFMMSRACGGLPIRDSQSGFRAFRRSTIMKLDLKSPGMELNPEMVIKASRAGLRMLEVPTGYRPRVGESKLRTFADGWRNLRTILFLAPETILIGPGLIATAIGLAMTAGSFVSPNGLPVGSLRWQPVFFSTIALVLGVLALAAGALLAHTSSVVTPKVQRRYAFVGHRRFLSRCSAFGLLAAGCGFVIDCSLLAIWATGSRGISRGLALASLGQSLIIIGVTLAAFGLVGIVLVERRRTEFVEVPAGGRSARDTAPL